MYGPLHHRWLDMDKTEALKIQKGNFDKALSLSSESIADLNWWCKSISTAYNPISHGAPQLTMTTDASLIGWGCSLQEATAGGGGVGPLTRQKTTLFRNVCCFSCSEILY